MTIKYLTTMNTQLIIKVAETVGISVLTTLATLVVHTTIKGKSKDDGASTVSTAK